ncbi:MAG: hypothetical protein WA130_12395 [Candidatus Methanoperedens sp.]
MSEYSTFPTFRGKWTDLGGETSAELRLNKSTQVGTYQATFLDTIHEESKRYAIIEFDRKDTLKMQLLENERYDIEDGNCIFVQFIGKDSEKVVKVHIRGKTH